MTATIDIARHAGFCFGVKRATDCVEELLRGEGSAKIYTLGKLIHNQSYIDELQRRGVIAIEEDGLYAIASSSMNSSPVILVIRAHGITRECDRHLAELSKRFPSFKVVDMTCPFVKRIHRIADENTDENTLFLLLGDSKHPEVRGIMSYAHGNRAALPDCESMMSYLKENYGKDGNFALTVASQTTQSTLEWKKCQKNIKKLCTNAKIFDTICSVTEDRQSEAREMSQCHDAMIVIGGRDSSNTKKLYGICRESCERTVWIERACELDAADFSDCKIGITAGASTPANIIMEVHDKMSTENFEELLEETLKPIHTGETVTGTIMAINDNAILVDLGKKVTGRITRDRLTDDMTADLSAMYKKGDEITAFVVRVSDKDGFADLDAKRIANDKAWLDIVALKESGETVKATVVAAIKGGVLAEVRGFKVFMPASQISISRVEDLSSVVGEEKDVVIIEVDTAKKRAVCSAKVIEKAKKKETEDKVWETLAVDQTFEGTVKNFIQHGAFVDIGGVDGFIPNSEISWKRIKHPSQVLTLEQTVVVYIKELDAENRKITLGYKTEEMDPFYYFKNNYKVGDDVDAKIVSIMPFGAFAEVCDGCDGLIHISKLSCDKVERPEDVVKVGDVVRARIIEIDVEGRKFNLSMRIYDDEARAKAKADERAAAKAERDAQRQAEAEEKAKEAAEYAPYIVKSVDS